MEQNKSRKASSPPGTFAGHLTKKRWAPKKPSTCGSSLLFTWRILYFLII